MKRRTLIPLVVSRAPQLNARLRAALAEITNNFSRLYDEPGLLQGIPELARWIGDGKQLVTAERDLERWEQQGIRVITLGMPEYPPQLATIHDPPLLIFVRGDELLLHRTLQVAVVGSRNADSEGIEFAHSIGRYGAERGATIVSGLAIGIDTAAHRGALESTVSGSTIAVLGSGFEHLYPRVNQRLADRIVASGGALVSQFEPTEKPLPHNFLDRNRVIAGLSRATIVVQAAARSGALATARYALEEGRDVAAVPGSLRSVTAQGSNRLLQQGALPFLAIQDLHQLLPELPQKGQGSAAGAIDPAHHELASWIGSQRECFLPEIPGYNEDPGRIMQALLELEMIGMVSRLPGNQISATIALREVIERGAGVASR